MSSGVLEPGVMVAVERELPRRASPIERYGRWSCSFSCLPCLTDAPPQETASGLHRGGLAEIRPPRIIAPLPAWVMAMSNVWYVVGWWQWRRDGIVRSRNDHW